jgi:hypothetical protein
MVTVSSFGVALVCHRFFGTDFEIMTGHGIEMKDINNK